jgi:hypothetical protein
MKLHIKSQDKNEFRSTALWADSTVGVLHDDGRKSGGGGDGMIFGWLV